MKIREVRFGTADLDETEAFYGTVLELPVQRTGSQLVVRAGWTELVLSEAVVSPGAQHLAFTIPRNRYLAAKRWLSERVDLLRSDGEDEFECAPFWNARSLYFKDPDRNVLEFIIRRDLPYDSEGAFVGGSILGVSEVGVPVEDVPAFQRTAQEVFGLDAYGQGGPTFRPIGDPYGLLIVVESGRTWFPTEQRAAEQPLQIALDCGVLGGIRANDSCLIQAS